MISLTAGEVAALTGGRLDRVDAGAQVTGPVVVDSRAGVPGALFVCVTGDHTDGHLHVADAYRRGAVIALAERPVDGPAVVVDDTVRALGFLAGGLLRRTSGCRVVGVTGSSGKTSTKDLLAAVLAAHAPTVAPAASLNNEIGLPLTVCQITAETRHLVLEYSARGAGHIAYLCGIARPAVGVVLNVGSAHLGEFGSRAAIAAAKGELVEALPADGVAVLGVDDPLVAQMRTRTAARVIGFGRSPDAEVRVEQLRLDDQARPRFRLATPHGAVEIALALTGEHQALNAAAVAAVALDAGLPLDAVAHELGAVTAVSAHRMSVMTRPDGLLVLDDAYNANPESVRAALDALARLGRGRTGIRWAVLGEMRELGEESGALHESIGRYAAACGVDRLVAVGEAGAAIAEGARASSGWSGKAETVADAEAAAALVGSEASSGDVVLVKASNAGRLWRVAEALVSQDAGVGA